MKTLRIYLIAFSLLTTIADQSSLSKERFDIPSSPALTAANNLKNALKRIEQDDKQTKALSTATQEALQLLPEISPAAESLRKSLIEYQSGGNSKDFSDSIRLVHKMLSFEPKKEAALPNGFPTYTPVGIIELKEYPA